MRALIFIIFLLAFASCRSTGNLVEVPVETKIEIRERLVPIPVPADSSTLTALFECDSLNQVQLSEIHELKSKRMQSELSFDKPTGTFNYDTKAIHDTIYWPAKDSLVYKDKPYPVEVEKIVYEQTALQKFLTIVGGIALFVVVMGVLLKFMKP